MIETAAPPRRMTRPGTSSAPTRPVIDLGEVQWRRTTPHLWVGYGQGGYVGTIECYRRSWATNPDGVTFGYFDSFEDCARALQTSAHSPCLAARTVQRRCARMTTWLLAAAALGLAVFGALAWALLTAVG